MHYLVPAWALGSRWGLLGLHTEPLSGTLAPLSRQLKPPIRSSLPSSLQGRTGAEVGRQPPHLGNFVPFLGGPCESLLSDSKFGAAMVHKTTGSMPRF